MVGNKKSMNKPWKQKCVFDTFGIMRQYNIHRLLFPVGQPELCLLNRILTIVIVIIVVINIVLVYKPLGCFCITDIDR